MKNKAALFFVFLGLCALMLGMFFGIAAGLQYLMPDFLKEIIPFNRLRPFHVTTVISWIVLCATGGIYFYLPKKENLPLFSQRMSLLHFILFTATGVMIYTCYATGQLGGKEYLEFPPILLLPIIAGWLLFAFNYYKSIVGKISNWPVYYWMWGTGILFMSYHLAEASLWLLPYFRENLIKDMTIQWKAGGSFVGSWNMLVYGTAIFLMSKIKGDDQIGRNKASFFFYFLGLSNLMFGWAHHIYILPVEPWIRYLSYGVSMTEWIILFHIIYSWKKSLPQQKKETYPFSYRFLAMADAWIFLNLILALLFSIPAINLFTHGTHITVAHSMGTTIGINTTILLGSVTYMVSLLKPHFDFFSFQMRFGFKLFQVSFVGFWISLLIAGIKKSNWMYFTSGMPFSEMQNALHTVYLFFLIFGVGIFLGLLLVVLPLLRQLARSIVKTN